jgi:opacity protein-like surface antigen
VTLSLMYGYDFNEHLRLYFGMGAALTLWSQGGGWENQYGPSYILGMRLRTFPRWRAGFEYRYLQVPGGLKEGGLARYFREDDLGGHQLFFTASFVKTFTRKKRIF